MLSKAEHLRAVVLTARFVPEWKRLRHDPRHNPHGPLPCTGVVQIERTLTFREESDFAMLLNEESAQNWCCQICVRTSLGMTTLLCIP